MGKHLTGRTENSKEDKMENREAYLRRCREVKERFAFKGVCMTDWARRRGFAIQTVYDVVNGRLAGKRGEAHRVAVALGLKEDIIEERTAS